MEQVESATAAIPEAMIEDAEEASRSPDEAESGPATLPMPRPKAKKGRGRQPQTAPRTAPVSAPAVANPWDGLLSAGMALLQQFAAPSGNGSAQPTAARVMRDDQTGETYLKVPVPSPEVLEQALKAVGSLLESLRK